MYQAYILSCNDTDYSFFGSQTTGQTGVRVVRVSGHNSAQAGHWQTFPGRELASVPRQGTGKRPRQGLQACPGRACTLASVPRQGTGKRPRQGLQTCPGRALANVPRQGTIDVPRQGTVVVPMQGTVGIAKV